MSDIKPTDRDTRSEVVVQEDSEESLQQNTCNSAKVANMRAATPYLCALYVATAGHQGNLLGSDEQEIVLLIYVVVDMTTNTVRIDYKIQIVSVIIIYNEKLFISMVK